MCHTKELGQSEKWPINQLCPSSLYTESKIITQAISSTNINNQDTLCVMNSELFINCLFNYSSTGLYKVTLIPDNIQNKMCW